VILDPKDVNRGRPGGAHMIHGKGTFSLLLSTSTNEIIILFLTDVSSQV